jgi:arsenite methyltransferase
MESKKVSTPEDEFSYFDVQAYWGVTKHMGGVDATDELASLCHIRKEQCILEVGCGTGVSACHLAKRYGCRVICVDLSGKMIEWSMKRALRKSIKHEMIFFIADAQNLPFEDSIFDVVLCESVTAFPKDKQRAVSEYMRVTKAGGYVGMNEGTWVKESPPLELVEYIVRTMAGAKFLPADGWRALLKAAGLAEIVVRTYKVDAFSQRLNEMKGLDFQDRLDRLRGVKDFVNLYTRNSNFRKYAKKIMPSSRIIKDLFAYLGYGIYVGRKV